MERLYLKHFNKEMLRFEKDNNDSDNVYFKYKWFCKYRR